MSSTGKIHHNLISMSVDTGNIPTEGYSKIQRKNVVRKTAEHEISYEILNYEKDMVCFDDKETSKFRSVVCDPTTKQVLSFAPAKSTEYSAFKEIVNIENTCINEIVEGTMIQLFYDFRIKKWEIATKGNVGGEYWYYRTQYANPEYGNYNEIPSQKTFRDMFLDVFQWGKDGELDPKGDIGEVEIFSEFDTTCCYTFVLQHPDNHIVGNYPFPVLYLVAVHKLVNRSLEGEQCVFQNGEWNDMPSVHVYMPDEYEKWEFLKMGAPSPILFPRRFSVNSYEELEKHIEALDTPFPMGYMLFDRADGMRAHIENPVYVELKKLRGNNPNMQFQYFSLLRAGKVDEYLQHFPVYKKQFREFEMQYKTFIRRVHQAYFSYYIRKNGGQIKKKYFIHASKIHHEIYLPSLGVEGEKKVITQEVVRAYFDAMTPQNIIYYLNYELRQH